MFYFIVKTFIDLTFLINLLKDSYTKKGEHDFKTFSMKLDIDSLESQVLDLLKSSNEIHIKIQYDSFEVFTQDTKENLDQLEICDDQKHQMFYRKIQSDKIEEIAKLFQEKHFDFISFLKKEGSQFDLWNLDFVKEDIEFCFDHAFLTPSVSEEEQDLNWHLLNNDYLLETYENQVCNLFDSNDIACLKWFEVHEGLDFNQDYKVHYCPNDIDSLDCVTHDNTILSGFEFRFLILNNDLYMKVFLKGLELEQVKVDSLNQDLENLRLMYQEFSQDFIYDFIRKFNELKSNGKMTYSLKVFVYHIHQSLLTRFYQTK